VAARQAVSTAGARGLRASARAGSRADTRARPPGSGCAERPRTNKRNRTTRPGIPSSARRRRHGDARWGCRAASPLPARSFHRIRRRRGFPKSAAHGTHEAARSAADLECFPLRTLSCGNATELGFQAIDRFRWRWRRTRRRPGRGGRKRRSSPRLLSRGRSSRRAIRAETSGSDMITCGSTLRLENRF